MCPWTSCLLKGHICTILSVFESILKPAAVTERGWLMKAGGKEGAGIRRRRWFILRGDVISYYRNKDDDFTVGSIPLNSLCSVIPPDEALATERNEWTFIVHSRHKSFHLTAQTQPDCMRWVNAIQDVIENAPTIETPTEKLIEELKSIAPSAVEALYEGHKVSALPVDCVKYLCYCVHAFFGCLMNLF